MIFAQTTSPDNWVAIVSSLGFPIVVAGALMWAILSGKLPRQAEIDDLRADKLRLQNEVESFRNQYTTLILPTMQDTILTIRDVASRAAEQKETSEKLLTALVRLDDMSRRVEIELAKRI